jgi:putative spermidine/putrescine transport system ATP-binding protein
MAALLLQGVTKMFGDAVAVSDLSLTIESGEFVSILGPSGCGKTTTLRMIAGFEQPDSGRILIDGQDVTVVSPQRRNIGFVFQSYALFPHMTVAQNVSFGLAIRKVPAAQAKSVVAATLALVRLGELGTRYPHQLSGGQQQRVALARALAIRPRLLLLDEPLSNLDAKLRDDMRDEVRRIQREVGITAIFVTHDQSEAFALADRVAVMDRGRLQQIADPVSIYETPANATVSSFIGQANMFEGSAAAVSADRVRVKLGDGTELLCVGTGLHPGMPCRTFIKYERVTLSRNAPARFDNLFTGTIASRTYLGDSARYVVATDASLTLRSAVPYQPGFEQFDLGEKVFAAFRAADNLAFGV